jgi:hypothetical protein
MYGMDGVDAPDSMGSHARIMKRKRQTTACRVVRVIPMSSEALYR